MFIGYQIVSHLIFFFFLFIKASRAIVCCEIFFVSFNSQKRDDDKIYIWWRNPIQFNHRLIRSHRELSAVKIPSRFEYNFVINNSEYYAVVKYYVNWCRLLYQLQAQSSVSKLFRGCCFLRASYDHDETSHRNIKIFNDNITERLRHVIC